jgi:hypothetical protein
MLDVLEKGNIKSLGDLYKAFQRLHGSYYEWGWNWASEMIENETGKSLAEFTSTDVISIVEKWKKSVVELDKLLYEDASKEFALSSMTGFGVDGGDREKKLDFEQVRGAFESNPIVSAIKDHILVKTQLGDELIGRMKKVRDS